MGRGRAWWGVVVVALEVVCWGIDAATQRWWSHRYGSLRMMEGERDHLSVIIILIVVVKCGIHFTICMEARTWIRETGIMSGRCHEARPTQI